MYFWNVSNTVEYFQKLFLWAYGYEWVRVSKQPAIRYIYILQVAVLDFGLGVIPVHRPVKVSPQGASQPAHKRYSTHLNGTDSTVVVCWF